MANCLRNSVQHARAIRTSIGAVFGGISAKIRPRLAGLRVLPLRIAAFAIAFAFPLFGGAGLAHAELLVSNIGQSLGTATVSTSEFEFAQGFRTGTNPNGYTIESIEIRFSSIHTNTAAPTVTLRKDSHTGTVVATLTAPSSFDSGNRTFSVPDPDNPPVLTRNTDYFVYVSGGSAHLDLTNSNFEDEGGKSGWNVHNSAWRLEPVSPGSLPGYYSQPRSVMRIRVNGTEIPPKVSSVAVTSIPRATDNTYGVGERIEFTVTFDQQVTVTGEPHFEFEMNGAATAAAFISGSGTDALVFGYTVQASDIDVNGINVEADAIKLDSGEHIRDAGNTLDAVLTHSELGTLSGHQVNGSRIPRSTDATLSALSLGTGVTLSPTFASDITTYRAWVANGVSSVSVTATTNDDGATVAITPGTAMISLTPGRNQIAVSVIAEFPSVTEEYTVTVVREASAPSADPNVDLTANVTVGEGSGTVGYSGGSPGWGAMTETRFRVGGKTYDFRAVVLAGDAPASPFNANMVALCFGAREPNDAVRNSLILSIDGHDFAFEGRSRLGTSRCYDWTQPVGLDWAWGDIALVKLSGNLPPEFGSLVTRRNVLGNTPANENVGAPVEAVDPDGDVLTYTLEGVDRDNFTIDDSGQIKTLAPLNPQGQNTHQVTVKADDGKGGTATIAVIITVKAIVTEVVVTSVKGPRYSTTSLIVRWTEPVRVDALAPMGYAVQYREGTSGPWRPYPHSGTATLTQIGSLSADTQYQVRVQALYGEGVSPSEWSEPGTGRVRTVVEGASFGTLGATIYQTQHLGTVPGAHFGESFEVKVRFTNPLTYRHDITDITGPNGEIFINPGPELADMIGPDRGIWVTSGTVESINIFDRRLLVLNVQPSGNDDVTLTLEPLPCNEQGALCSGNEGLADRVRYTVRGVKDVPSAPRDLQVETVQEGEDELMKVFFDGTNEATKSRVQWKFPSQEWSEAEEHWRWWSVGPEGRHLSVSARVKPRFGYDVRARWESPFGEGPWAYATRAGAVSRRQWRENITWYQKRGTNGNVNGAEVHIEYGRELNHDAPIDLFNDTGTPPPFRVSYSESRVLGRSVRAMRIIDTTDDNTYNPRTVKLNLSGVIGDPSPHTEEQVYVTYTGETDLQVLDKAGNPAPAFNTLPATFVPGRAPAEFRRRSARPVSGQLLSSGNQIYVTFDWKLSPLGIPSPDEFTVKVDGTPIGTIFAPDRFTIFDENVRNIRLGVSPRIRQRRTVTVTYNKPNNANKALRDRAGNQVDSFEDFEVTNNSDLGPSSRGFGPAPVSAAAAASGAQILLTMDEAVDLINIPSKSTFTITVDGTGHSPSSVLGGFGTDSYILYLTTVINRDQVVTIGYTDPNPGGDNSDGVIQDTDGNDGSSFTNFRVTNSSTVVQGPALSVADAEATENIDTTLNFVVTLNPAATTSVTVEYTTSDGTATQGNDYTATSGSLEFLSGETTMTVSVPITDDLDEDDGETLMLTLSNAVGARLADAEAIGTIRNTEEALTAEFRDISVEAHDGSTAFTFELRFSEDWTAGLSHTTLLNHAFTVTNGEVTGVRRLEVGKNQRWEITVEPDGNADVTIELPATTDCGDTGAICIATRPLSAGYSVTVRGSPPVTVTPAPVTAEFRDISVTTHDGSTAFTFELRFSEDWTAGLSHTTLLNHAFTVTNGEVTGVRRLEAGKNQRWEITVEPDGNADVAIRLLTTTDCGDPGAICIGIRPLSAGDTATVPGPPPGLSMADARGTESAGETVDFAVSLSRVASEIVTVDYTTSNGSATAEVDFADTSGTLTFLSGETSKTVSVAVLDDTHDEDDETFTLTLSNASGGNAYLKDATATGTIEDDDEPAVALTAEIRDISVTAHDGSTAFTFELRFSENWTAGLSLSTLRDAAFTVTNGEVTKARRLVPGKNKRWEITVEPDGNADVTITLPATTDCGASGAICIGTRPLSAGDSKTVPGPVPLTAEFRNMSVTAHDGSAPFTFELRFSEEVTGLSYASLREAAFTVTNGQVAGVRRLVPGKNKRWEITVEPDGNVAVTIRLPATTDCGDAGAICIGGNRPLSAGDSATVPGPPSLSVDDARGTEAEGETVDFVVGLSRTASEPVTVDYATSNGTAKVGADYVDTSGTLTFTVGETSKTVSVALLDDAHDEGEETFTLTLSNASGGSAYLSDATATGTIENRDPMPKAFLARFARASAVQVVEQVAERIRAPRKSGLRAKLAGRELRPGLEREIARDVLNGLASLAGARAPAEHGRDPMGGFPAGEMAGAESRRNLEIDESAPKAAGGMDAGGLLRMGAGGGDMVTGSNFEWNRETGQGVVFSLWSRGAQTQFMGREGELSVDGRVRATMMGADFAKGPLMAGLTLSHRRGRGGYTGVDVGDVTTRVTGLYPWLGYKASDRVTFWGVTGYGKGALTLTPGEGDPLESRLSMAMAAGGLRSDLAASGLGGLNLAFKADALWVGTGIEGVEGPSGRLAATEAVVTRYRTALEAAREFGFERGLMLGPSLEIGLRRDGGDAETGTGMDLGGGLIVSDLETGLRVDVRVRFLMVHQDEGYRDRGLSVSLSYDPTPSTPLGFKARVAPAWGGQAQSGAGALWNRPTMAGMAPGVPTSGQSLQAEFGYGLPIYRSLVVSPRIGIGTSEYGRDYQLGYDLALLQEGTINFDLGFDVSRRESPGRGNPVHGVRCRLTTHW